MYLYVNRFLCSCIRIDNLTVKEILDLKKFILNYWFVEPYEFYYILIKLFIG